jgi:hypothetical protein
VRDGDHYVINGTKRFITSGKNAGLVIVTAKTDEALRHKGISAFRGGKGHAGFHRGPYRGQDGPAGLGHHRPDLRKLPGTGGQPAGAGGRRVQDRHDGPGRRPHRHCGPVGGGGPGRPGRGGQVRQKREQFGQAISKFQGLRWTIADMATEIEAARQLMSVGRRHEGPGRALQHAGLHGQAVRLRDGQPGDGQGPADPRRLRVHQGLPGGALTTAMPGCSPSTKAPPRSSGW